ncbi:hypothetical protein EKN06_09305 [Croceicoccus ponticola]|uniref:Type I restriction modification DNA specificity domain-containing protein n=1 Tax=Croceicoccus ponticola TaxID=2217664 RepID=A0A437GXK7_9SPHN|nr:restriction endonuclease subunit S [Croceicoccus ponticola]RVQ67107.1 hypothetical protein EKN06_09305 [Croceicoccus ponticola]
MNAALLLDHYARIADAPDAIARLRRFVLDLAVRGKLVEQDAGDEAATGLLVAVKVKEFEHHSKLVGWAEAKLGQLLQFQYGKGLHANERRENGAVPVFGSNGIVAYTHTALTEKPSIIVGRKGSAGALNLCTSPSWTTDVAYFVEAPTYFSIHYLLLALSALGLDHLGKGVKPGLSRSDAYALTIGVPPLAEQHRIVAKVDELMALCDQLEAARAEREAARDTFTLSTLAKLNTDPATFDQDASFALANLAPLTTRPDQIKLLRQTILRLALAGKLTHQDEMDEPASKLLAKIETSRSALLRSGYPNVSEARTQQRKVAEQALPIELPALPRGWQYATLQQCALMVIDCKNKTAPYTQNGIRLIRTTNVRDGKLNTIDQRYVSPETYEIWSARAKSQPGDILITREAPMGEVCLIPNDTTICLGQRMMLARLVPDTINPRFMLYSLMDPDLMDRVQDKPIGMTVQHLRVGGVETLIVLLPPLAEQRRIVAKVDELMTLCDHLQASLDISEKVRSKLLEAVLHYSLSTDTERTGAPAKSAGEAYLEAV